MLIEASRECLTVANFNFNFRISNTANFNSRISALINELLNWYIYKIIASFKQHYPFIPSFSFFLRIVCNYFHYSERKYFSVT